LNIKLDKLTKHDLDKRSNDVLTKQIDLLKLNIETFDAKQSSTNQSISKLNIANAGLEAKKQSYIDIIDEIKQYENANNVWKIFQHTISNKGLNKYVFDTVAMQINSELNALLDGLNYRIYFDLQDNYTLKMIDLLGYASVRNLYTIGGMETTLGALSLVAIIKSKTIKNNGDFLFIDEITGKLNNGEDTKGTESTNKDYQYEFFNILTKLSKTTNICIIDHVLSIDWFKGIINVVKYDNGKSELV
jgi:DNA repair exonuclease SbcCD ATPase subunit